MSSWDALSLWVFRPLLAIFFVFSLIVAGWVAAWKLILVHIPLVQEICELRKKPVQSKPVTGRLSRFYNARYDRTAGTSLCMSPPSWSLWWFGILGSKSKQTILPRTLACKSPAKSIP